MKTGERNLITDVAGLKVGNAEDHALKSGTTVLTADRPFVASCFVMGGAPGTRDTDLLEPDKTVEAVDALVLSGGSAFGLDAASGVSDGLRAAGRGFSVGAFNVPIVPAAIVFDLMNGGDKGWTENPYRALGRQALANASADFALGHRRSRHRRDDRHPEGRPRFRLAGAALGPHGRRPRRRQCGRRRDGRGHAAFLGGSVRGRRRVRRHRTVPAVSTRWRSREARSPDALKAQANTTIAIVATDAALTKAGCKRLAIVAHDGLARAIVPAHTPYDGDLVFALSTRRKAAVGPATRRRASRLCGRALPGARHQPRRLLRLRRARRRASDMVAKMGRQRSCADSRNRIEIREPAGPGSALPGRRLRHAADKSVPEGGRASHPIAFEHPFRERKFPSRMPTIAAALRNGYRRPQRREIFHRVVLHSDMN